jgi:hypothetical protein
MIFLIFFGKIRNLLTILMRDTSNKKEQTEMNHMNVAAHHLFDARHTGKRQWKNFTNIFNQSLRELDNHTILFHLRKTLKIN